MRKLQIIAKKIHELIVANQFILYLAVFMLSFFIFLLIQSYPTFLDPDSFYHLKITKLIAEQGPIINFPWLQFTVLKDYYIDHHFFYHLVGIPFVGLLGDFAGYKFYTIILNTLLIVGLYFFLKKEKIKYAEIFILLLLSSQGFIFRISLAKASAFSLILLFLGIYFIFKRKKWPLFFVSWLYVWSYGGFLLIWVMAAMYILADSLHLAFLDNRTQGLRLLKKIKMGLQNILAPANLKIGLASFFGVLIGVVFNPYFPKNLNFIWEQLVQIGLINYVGKVNVGGEWYPYKLPDLFLNMGVSFIVLVIIITIFVITIKKQKTASVFFFLCTIFFFIFTLKSKRYIEYLMPFAVFFTAYACTLSLANLNLWQKIKDWGKLSKLISLLIYIAVLLAVIFFPMVMVRDAVSVYQDYRRGINFNQFAGVGAYLKNNSQPGEIIMQTDWDDFPMLFYQNSQNYYIVGLDPTFMYSYDPDLYKLFADITMAKVSTNLSQQVKDNFQAGYFIVDKDRGKLNSLLQADSGFDMVYEDRDCWLYKLK